MSDEALNAHLHWLDKCAKEQGDDYETWLENRATQLEEELATLTNSLEMTWGVILQRNPSVGGHISYAAERGFEKLETALSIAMSENQRLTKYVEDYEEEIEDLETQLSLSISMYEGDRSPMHNLQVENDTLKAKLLAIECAGCGKTMLECECDG